MPSRYSLPRSVASVDVVAKPLAAFGLNRLTCIRVTPKAKSAGFRRGKIFVYRMTIQPSRRRGSAKAVGRVASTLDFQK